MSDLATGSATPPRRVRAVAFDLLTGLLDSWTVWDRAAGSIVAGRSWRMTYLALTYEQGRYVSYESLVARAARDVGIPQEAVGALFASWDTIQPWPEVQETLAALALDRPLAIVTNCSSALAERAVARLGPVAISSVVTAEMVGAYKPDPRTYQRMLREVGYAARDTLFVAGSPYDVAGATRAGMPVFWHNRAGLARLPEGSLPVGAFVVEHSTLSPIVPFVLGDD